MKRMMILAGAVLLLACGNDAEQTADENAAVESSSEAPPAASNDAPPSGPINAELAECQHAPQASIYDRPAKLWRAERQGDDYLTLTVWEYTAGGSEFSVHHSKNGNTYQINTVRGSQNAGSGTVQVQTQGDGVAFTVRGKDQNGNDLHVDVRCAKVVPLVAEGG